MELHRVYLYKVTYDLANGTVSSTKIWMLRMF